MTTKQDAMEAAARALCEAQGYVASENELARASEEALACVTAYLAAREAEGPATKQVEAVAKLLRSEGYSGDSYRTARHAIRLMFAARPTNGDS